MINLTRSQWLSLFFCLMLMWPLEDSQAFARIPHKAKPNAERVKNVTKPRPCPVDQDKIVVGEAEIVTLKPENMVLKARIDTGAKKSTLGVRQHELFEVDGKRWVKFTVTDPKTKKDVEFKRPLERFIKIKQQSGPADKRPVVKMRVQLGPIESEIVMTLSKRGHFAYPVLVGRNFLSGRAVVDISLSYNQSGQKDQ